MKLKQQTYPFGTKENKEETKQYKTTDNILGIYCLISSLLTILTPVEIHVLVWFTKQYFFRISEFLSILSITMYLNICFCLCYLAKGYFTVQFESV